MNNGECDVMTLQQFIDSHIEEWKAEIKPNSYCQLVYSVKVDNIPAQVMISVHNTNDTLEINYVALYPSNKYCDPRASNLNLVSTPSDKFADYYYNWIPLRRIEGVSFPVALVEGEWGSPSVATKEESVLLDDGSHLMNKFGKYEPNLCFLSKLPYIMWRRTTAKEYNLSPKCSLCYVRGTFFKSKKGTNCFRLNENGPHILLRDDWGGAFEKYRGRKLPEDQLYYRRASSNGGGCGYDYAVVPLGWRKVITEDDI